MRSLRTGTAGSLASLAQLMAYAVEADGRVSPEELETLQTFLGRRYGDSARAQFFDLFRRAIDERPDIERIVSDIHDGLPAYGDRLDVYATIQTLLNDSGLTPEESASLGRIAALLDIAPEDADLLANATRPQPDFRFPLNRDRLVHVGGAGVAAAGVLSPRFTAMSLADFYAVASDTEELFLDGLGHPPGEIVFVRAGDRVRIGSSELDFAGLSRLFDLARSHVSAVHRLALEDGRITRVAADQPASFELHVHGANLLLLKRDPAPPVHVNGEPIDAGAVLLPADVLRFEHGEIGVSRLLDAIDRDAWPLADAGGAAFRYVIASRAADGTEHVLEDLDAPVSIVIAESADPAAPVSVTCEVCDTRAPVRLGDTPLRAGATVSLAEPAPLQIGHHWFAIDPHRRRVEYSRRIVERFEARDVLYRFKNTVGVNRVTFTAAAGELVGIMGGSGAGKSTLLGVLLGTLAPDEGEVLLNGHELRAQVRRRRSILGYVPQDDLLMDSLTVEENLLYTGRIRLPAVPEADLRARVARVLRDVGLFEKKDLRVGSPVAKVLSGGQRKRLNIGIELLADPELCFLDEPTSGLSSQDSRTIITLLRQLTRRGKLVFVVIHQPSSDIYKMFDKLLVLDAGGVLVWYGEARDAVRHFKGFLPDHRDFVECPACGSINPETVLNAIEQPMPAIAAPGAAPARRFDPEFWRNAFALLRQADPAVAEAAPLPQLPAAREQGRARALGAAVARAFVDRARNRTNIVMSIAAPLVLGGAMAGLLRGPDVPYTYSGNAALGRFFFLSTIVFVFFGLMASVNEVIRELALIRRERVAGFAPAQYVVAKAAAFLPFSALQVALFTAVASWVLGFPSRAPAGSLIQPALPFPVFFGIVVFLIAQAAFALGLFISSCLRSQVAAFNWVPLVIVPQILFGGVFVGFPEMPKIANRVVPEYAELTFSRWGYEALLAGEKVFNPSDHVNADTIVALRDRALARGVPFDLRTQVDAPLDRWRATPGMALPPARISASVMQDTLLHRLRTGDQTADADALERAYQQRDRRTYVMKLDLAAPDVTRVAAILMSPDTGWWASAFAVENVNAALEADRQAANLRDPDRVSVLRQVVTDRSDFPAVTRVIGSTDIPVVLWNTCVLVAMILGCYIASVVRLRYGT